MEPCKQMNAIVSTGESTAARPGGAETSIIRIRINYMAQEFRETRNNQAFGFMSLWSQIGGFVGILLGYSLLQVPELLEYFSGWVKRTLKPKAHNCTKDIPATEATKLEVDCSNTLFFKRNEENKGNILMNNRNNMGDFI